MNMNRRAFLAGMGAWGTMGGISWGTASPFLMTDPVAPAGRARVPVAKSVIEIWLWGGPSQLETFDPKPKASSDYNDNLKAIETNVKGIEVSEWLPQLARQADKYALVRTMTHKYFGHETASYLMQTGREPGGGRVFPAIGALVSLFKSREYHGDIPPYVILTIAKGRFSEEGFLGGKFKPLVTGGKTNAQKFVVDGIMPPDRVPPELVKKRFDLLARLDTLGMTSGNHAAFERFDQTGKEARRMMEGGAAKVFDLSLESEQVRDQYGRNEFGQSCLAARRLVEAGVPYITINAQGWDSHKRHFETMKKKTADFDQALAMLLKDLADKGLLDTTVVWCSGEFGRTPKIMRDAPWNNGRGHYARCFSAMVAGGGFQGGRVVGVSDETASNVVSRPVAPQDLLGSILERCGINPDGKFPSFTGVDATILPPASAAGRLKELYPGA